jgi:hypothetical protein
MRNVGRSGGKEESPKILLCLADSWERYHRNTMLHVLIAACLQYLLFDPEDGSSTFLWNVLIWKPTIHLILENSTLLVSLIFMTDYIALHNRNILEEAFLSRCTKVNNERDKTSLISMLTYATQFQGKFIRLVITWYSFSFVYVH